MLRTKLLSALIPLVLSTVAASTHALDATSLVPSEVGFHLASVHSGRIDPVSGRPWNNANPGVYARWDRVLVGTYRNSIDRRSLYAGYLWTPLGSRPDEGGWGLDLVAGVVTGYDGPGRSAKAVMPMVIPSLRIPLGDNVLLRLNLALGVQRGSASAVNLALGWRF